MNYKYFILLFSPFLLQSQQVEIKILSNNINTNSSEFNFIQVNDTMAFYSSLSLEGDNYQSAIYKTVYRKGKWQKGKYENFGRLFSAANIYSSKNDIWTYFTACDNMSNCKIVRKDRRNSASQFLNNSINLKNSNNTQPHITNYKKQSFA